MGDIGSEKFPRLLIEFSDEKYTARVVSPDDVVQWSSGEPLEHDALQSKILDELDWHQRDVAEAFFDANPELLEVLRGTEFEYLIDRDRTADYPKRSWLRRLVSTILGTSSG